MAVLAGFGAWGWMMIMVMWKRFGVVNILDDRDFGGRT